ncbi:prolipoprotein diacylglyceryl transferase [Terrimesophilobacter mesophilus]|uniref:Phosphatidylglycerol--prolipoprotein diacylglyceryl transferase n=1 Tax=Terrimesophilobacter mesophilus TaxID=433647 RepID=A0A4R8VES1_9MICO|nr:prolipoprotein diacylglyceryl transferase [Terrimesophilobacter mesophilus]TFB80680.1 prolipoprotein diacylglyceryl transferase [Terrimesophilobacter mesophilus]
MHDIGLTWVTIPIPIHAYALCILAGIIAATILTGYRLKQRGADAGVVLDIALWAVPFGIIGGRIFHVITHPDDYFGAGKDLLKTLYIWEGGMAIFGALMLGAVGTLIGCRLAGVRFWSFADALAPSLLLAQAFGRLGNYFNHELFGLPTNLPWGLEIESTNAAFPAGLPAGTLFHPTFLYEIIWNLIGVGVLLFLERRWRMARVEIPFVGVEVLAPKPGAYRFQWGKMLGLYLIWYGIGRSFFESIRIDPSEIFFGIRTNVWAAFGAILVGLIIIVVQSRRHPGIEPSPYLPGHEWSADAVVHSEDVYTDSDFEGNDDSNSSEPSGSVEAQGAKAAISGRTTS